MRRILVTGANKGIGLAIVRAILEEHEDTFVVLGSRDGARGSAALAELGEAQPGWMDRTALLELDVASDASVAAAAATVAGMFRGEPAPLYALVNNAGVGLGVGDMATTLNINTVGVRRMCEAFGPLLDPKAGRIVNTSSAAGPNFVSACGAERQRFFIDASIEWPALQAVMDACVAIEGDEDAFAAAGLGKGDAYGLSKACLNSFTMLLARKHPALRVHAFTPGFIATDLTRPYAEAQGKSAADMGMKPPSAGARPAMFLLFGEPEGNGNYYGSDSLRSPLDRYRAPGDPPYSGE